MLARARASAPKELPVDFVQADATVYPFDPASFDLLASRFGVMFFADPVLSFANMRKALQAVGAAGVRLLARAARKSLDDGAAAGGLQTRAETAAAGAGRSRAVRVRLRSARAPDPRRGRLYRHRDGGVSAVDRHRDRARARWRRCRARSKSARRSRALEGQPADVRAAAINSMREALAPFAKGDTVPLPGIDLDRHRAGLALAYYILVT